MDIMGRLQPVIIIVSALLGLLLGAFTPVFAYLLGKVFFGGSIDIRIGLLMLLVTPCTDWYLVFTGLSNGNVELGMSILPLNLILHIVLLPVYLFIFIGSEVQMDALGIVSSTVFVLIIPFLASLVTKALTKNRESFASFLEKQSDNLQLLFLCLAQLVGRKMGFAKPDIVALNFTTLARNSPLSLAIAVATFPDRPLISLALVIGPLIELPVLSVISGILARWNKPEMQSDKSF